MAHPEAGPSYRLQVVGTKSYVEQESYVFRSRSRSICFGLIQKNTLCTIGSPLCPLVGPPLAQRLGLGVSSAIGGRWCPLS